MSNLEFRLLPWEHRGILPAPAHQFEARPGIDFTFVPPTMHERIEAQLQLREWLRERVSGEDVARLVAT